MISSSVIAFTVIIRAEKVDISAIHLLKGSRIHLKALHTVQTNKYMHFVLLKKIGEINYGTT